MTGTAAVEPLEGLGELPPVDVVLPPPLGPGQRRAPGPAIGLALVLHAGLVAMFASELQPYVGQSVLPDAVAVSLVDAMSPAHAPLPAPVPDLDAPPAPALPSLTETVREQIAITRERESREAARQIKELERISDIVGSESALADAMRGSVTPEAPPPPAETAPGDTTAADPAAGEAISASPEPASAAPEVTEGPETSAASAALPKAAETARSRAAQRPAQRPAPGRSATATGGGAPAIIVGAYVSRARQLVVERMPRVRGIKGRVVIELVIGIDGVPERAELVERSGRNELDEFVLASVRRMRFPPPAADMTRQQRTFHAPFNY